MAPPAIFTSFSAGHDHAFALQKYLLLDTQHQELRQHVEAIRTTISPSSNAPSATSSTSSSPAVSPTRPRHASAGGFESSRRRASIFEAREDIRRSRSQSRGPPASGDTLGQLAEEERRLYDVSEGIKRALTELLNCDVARSDAAFRSWVQRRLMDAEKELRVERRRRSAV